MAYVQRTLPKAEQPTPCEWGKHRPTCGASATTKMVNPDSGHVFARYCSWHADVATRRFAEIFSGTPLPYPLAAR